MGIMDTGRDSDFYRLKDRKAAMAASQLAGEAKNIPHLRQLMLQIHPKLMKEAAAFADKLELLSRIAAVRTSDGVDIKKAIENGDCIYIIGSTNRPQIIMLQKMILLRIKQVVERRNKLESQRHLTMFIDETKYFLTRPFLETLAMIRDTGCNIALAHQAFSDLYDVSQDINPKSCYGTVMSNTNIKIIYQQNEPDDQIKAASLTGDKNIIRESKEVLNNEGMGKVVDTDRRHEMTAKEYLYSRNFFAVLKPRIGVITGLGIAKLFFTSSIKVDKQELVFESHEACPDYKDPDENVKELSGVKPLDKSKNTNKSKPIMSAKLEQNSKDSKTYESDDEIEIIQYYDEDLHESQYTFEEEKEG